MRFVTHAVLLAVLAGCSGEETAPTHPVSPSTVTVTVLSALGEPHAARVVWQLQPSLPGELLVQRRLGTAPWKGLAWLAADPEGKLTLEDGSVQPGASYAYRVRVVEGKRLRFTGEVAVEIPAR